MGRSGPAATTHDDLVHGAAQCGNEGRNQRIRAPVLNVSMSLRSAFYHYLQITDYRYLLPMLARLPVPLGQALATVRGLVNAGFDLDWRSLSLGERFIWRDTYQAMELLRPGEARSRRVTRTVLRFVNNSREEWEACLFSRRRMERVLKRSTVAGLAAIEDAQQRGTGVVLMTSHFDSFLTGVVLLGLHGLRVNVVTSTTVEHPKINPAIQAFYWRKYRGIERYLNGGLMVHHEENLRYFYRALERGEVVVILGDLPAQQGASHIAVPFLDGIRRVPAGPLRMARRTGSLLGAFVCLHQGPGRYHLHCAPLERIGQRDAAAVISAPYAFLDSYIRRYPERWWAADLLLHFKNVEPQHVA